MSAGVKMLDVIARSIMLGIGAKGKIPVVILQRCVERRSALEIARQSARNEELYRVPEPEPGTELVICIDVRAWKIRARGVPEPVGQHKRFGPSRFTVNHKPRKGRYRCRLDMERTGSSRIASAFRQ